MEKKHTHLDDFGFSSLIAYFFCILVFGFIRQSGLSAVNSEDDILVLFLAFVAATCLTLLLLAMSERYLLQHDNQKRFALLAAVLLMCGPLFCVIGQFADILYLPLVILSFFLSGCGFAISLLVWGRILSEKKMGNSSRQVLADTCLAILIVILVAALPETPSLLAIALLGLIAGLVAAYRAQNTLADIDSNKQIVISDTRNSIPLISCLSGGLLWMAYGVSLVLLNGINVLSGPLGAVLIAVIAVAAIAIIAIIGQHRGLSINLTRAYWATVPLIVVGLAIIASNEKQLLSLSVVLIVSSMVISQLHLMSHFAALANRPDILSDQIFAWGWLAPFLGMFVGIFIGVVCQLANNPALNLVLPIMVGVLVVTLIITMHSIEKIASRRRQQEAKDHEPQVDTSASQEAQADEVFSSMGLSSREKEVALLLLQGRSQSIIADQLFVAPSTVNTHVKHIYRKTCVSSKQQFIDLFQMRLKELADN